MGSAHLIHDGLDYFVAIERTRCNYGGSRPYSRALAAVIVGWLLLDIRAVATLVAGAA